LHASPLDGMPWAPIESMRTLSFCVVLLVFAGVLCALPLFDLLGYEFSFAMALAVTLAAINLGSVKIQRTPSERTADDARPLRALLRLGGVAVAKSWWVLALPLALSLLNGLRVRNCDRAGGLLWF